MKSFLLVFVEKMELNIETLLNLNWNFQSTFETAPKIIHKSFHTFLKASQLGYTKINQSPVSYSKCFSDPIYHKISSNSGSLSTLQV